MKATFQREMDFLERHLAFLASTGSVSPYVGLFAAIPAVVAYNRYAYDVERLGNRFESFMEEFSNILHRQAVK